jgi:hypothetical protein
LAGERTRDLLILFIIPWTNVVSGMIKRFRARSPSREPILRLLILQRPTSALW